MQRGSQLGQNTCRESATGLGNRAINSSRGLVEGGNKMRLTTILLLGILLIALIGCGAEEAPPEETEAPEEPSVENTEVIDAVSDDWVKETDDVELGDMY